MKITLGLALVIFLALTVLKIALIFLVLFNKGMLVKNPIIFALTQLYTIITAILILMIRANGNIFGYILGIIYIAGSICAIIIKKNYERIARILTVTLIALSFLTFWYTEYFYLFIVIPIVAVVIYFIILKKSK